MRPLLAALSAFWCKHRERNVTAMATATKTQPRATAQLITAAALAAFLHARQAPLAIDTETTGLSFQQDSLVTIQLGDSDAVYVYDVRGMRSADRDILAAAFADIARRGVELLGHNLKFDLLFLRAAFGVRFLVVRDTMLQEAVLLGGLQGAVIAPHSAEDSDSEGDTEDSDAGYSVLAGASLAATAARYGLAANKELQTAFLALGDGPLTDAMLRYIADDIRLPWAIAEAQAPLLAEAGLAKVARIENAALPGIVDMEWHGMAVDVQGWRAYLAREQERADALEAEIQATLAPAWAAVQQSRYATQLETVAAWRAQRDAYKASLAATGAGLWDIRPADKRTAAPLSKAAKTAAYAAWRAAHPQPKAPKAPGEAVNLASPAQVKEALALLGVHVASTDKRHLALAWQSAAPGSPVRACLAALAEWKGKNKLISSFGETVLSRVTPQGRIHPDFWQIGARTGRMSCHSPNWQQLPRPGAGDDSIRQHVIAGPGNVLCIADYSNIELRILAEISQDETMLGLFAQGADLHCALARQAFNLGELSDKEIKHLHSTERSRAKTLNFGIVYGMGPSKLAASLDISLTEARVMMQAYFALYPGVQRWLEYAAAFGLAHGYSLTLAGRRRYYRFTASPDDYETYQAERSLAERQAKNSPIQGTSADISKLAIALLARDLPDGAFMTCVVHDEIIVECPAPMAEAVGALLAQDMQRAASVYLRTVANPLPDVSVAAYWQKG
jgi:DNA polymerase-1